jgi:hypothetical protein
MIYAFVCTINNILKINTHSTDVVENEYILSIIVY